MKGHAEVDEDGDGKREKNCLHEAHSRPSAQVRPSIAATKATTATTTRRSAMAQIVAPATVTTQ
jgi:hypothetical protein